MQRNALNIKTVTKQVWFYFIRGTTCTSPGYARTITNLQIVLILNTPQNPCLLIKLPKKYLPKFSYPKKSRNRKFKPKKILRPSALSLEIRSTPPPHPEGAEVWISFRELHITVLEPKTGYFAIVVCSLRIPIEWLNQNHYWLLFWKAGETLLRKDSSDHDHLRADSGFFFYNLYQGRLQAPHR